MYTYIYIRVRVCVCIYMYIYMCFNVCQTVLQSHMTIIQMDTHTGALRNKASQKNKRPYKRMQTDINRITEGKINK